MSRPAGRGVVRGLATAALVASVAVPLLRRRHRIPAAATVAATAAGPFALAVLFPRTRTRDAALFAMQMWGFTMAHELPYDDPVALRRRLRVRYPIVADRILGLGQLPSVRLQRAFSGPGDEVTALDRALSVIHWSWFIEPHLALVYILARREEHFARSARQMSAAYDLGCFVYYALPTAPPWWSSEQGEIKDELRRIMVDVGERTWGRAWPVLYDSLGGNPWAAMPSLHFATSVMAAILLAETGPVAGAVGWAYAGALGFALVYLAEHYVIDLVAGATLVALVRRGEPLVEPLALAISRGTQRLERVANS